MRAEGFYWVNWGHNQWSVAEYDGAHWYLPGVEIMFDDAEFKSINEEKLRSPE